MSFSQFNNLMRFLNDVSMWDSDDWDTLRRPTAPLMLGYCYPGQRQQTERSLQARNTGVASLVNDKEQFKVNLDVQQYKPEEITVKVVDKHVVIEGKHEERADEHGYISRQFQRRYLLPSDVDPNSVVSQLSSDGVLSIGAPKKATQLANQRNVPITVTNQPAIQPTEEKKDGAVAAAPATKKPA